MTVNGHIEALTAKHNTLEKSIHDAQARPQPDFAAIAELKKRKLQVKEELDTLLGSSLKQQQA